MSNQLKINTVRLADIKVRAMIRKKVVANSNSSAHIYLPKGWIGKEVLIILPDTVTLTPEGKEELEQKVLK